MLTKKATAFKCLSCARALGLLSLPPFSPLLHTVIFSWPRQRIKKAQALCDNSPWQPSMGLCSVEMHSRLRGGCKRSSQRGIGVHGLDGDA